MDYNLFLDDKRNPSEAWLHDEKVVLNYAAGTNDWVIVRSFDEFKEILEKRGMPAIVSFDHDLHFEHMRHYLAETITTGYIDYPSFKHKTGMHAAQLMMDKVLRGAKMPNCFVHSANHAGRANIKRILKID